MDPHDLDDFSRALHTTGSRRAALAAVMGGALATQSSMYGEAKNKKARSGSLANLKPISMWVDNTAGTGPVVVHHGEHYREGRRMCCRILGGLVVMPGAKQRFAGNTTVGYLWINEYFWLQFENVALQRPDVSAAINGSMGEYACCPPRGQVALANRGMKERQSLPINLEGRVFTVRRDKDTNYKVFTVMLPVLP